MNLHRPPISAQLWEQTEKLLDRWFAEGLTRSSVLPFRSSEFEHDAALLGAKVFKRGARCIRDLDSNQETQLEEPQEKESASKIMSLSGWKELISENNHDFFDAASSIFIVDRKLAELHPFVVSSLNTLGIRVLTIDCTEQNKNLTTAISLCRMIDMSCTRIVAVGGGICCDVAGFVGGLLDVEIVMVPTTLLAAVDAGTGGKTGVNHPSAGKNQIGLFANIKSVVLINDLFKTLTPQLVHEGLGEIVKHAWLNGKFETWKTAIETLLDDSSTQAFADAGVIQLIEENITFKKTVVQADPREKNIRVMLNLGHTIAHLLESLSLEISKSEAQQCIPSHGQAVSLGLWSLMESGLLSNPPDGLKSVLQRLNDASGLRFPILRIGEFRKQAVHILLQDKKNIQNNSSLNEQRVRCVLPSYGCLKTIPDSLAIDDFLSANTAALLPDELIDHLLRTGLVR
ncbi:MAG: hypothetical protein RI953_1450 [Pseudomonadota bacterium]|jgi:3-dehydroquinate synthase